MINHQSPNFSEDDLCTLFHNSKQAVLDAMNIICAQAAELQPLTVCDLKNSDVACVQTLFDTIQEELCAAYERIATSLESLAILAAFVAQQGDAVKENGSECQCCPKCGTFKDPEMSQQGAPCNCDVSTTEQPKEAASHKPDDASAHIVSVELNKPSLQQPNLEESKLHKFDPPRVINEQDNAETDNHKAQPRGLEASTFQLRSLPTNESKPGEKEPKCQADCRGKKVQKETPTIETEEPTADSVQANVEEEANNPSQHKQHMEASEIHNPEEAGLTEVPSDQNHEIVALEPDHPIEVAKPSQDQDNVDKDSEQKPECQAECSGNKTQKDTAKVIEEPKDESKPDFEEPVVDQPNGEERGSEMSELRVPKPEVHIVQKSDLEPPKSLKQTLSGVLGESPMDTLNVELPDVVDQPNEEKRRSETSELRVPKPEKHTILKSEVEHLKTSKQASADFGVITMDEVPIVVDHVRKENRSSEDPPSPQKADFEGSHEQPVPKPEIHTVEKSELESPESLLSHDDKNQIAPNIQKRESACPAECTMLKPQPEAPRTEDANAERRLQKRELEARLKQELDKKSQQKLAAKQPKEESQVAIDEPNKLIDEHSETKPSLKPSQTEETPKPKSACRADCSGVNKPHTEDDQTNDDNTERSLQKQELEARLKQELDKNSAQKLASKQAKDGSHEATEEANESNNRTDESSETKNSSEIPPPHENETTNLKPACRPDCHGVNKPNVDDPHPQEEAATNEANDKPDEVCEQSPPCREDCTGVKPIDESNQSNKLPVEHSETKPVSDIQPPQVDESNKPKTVCRADCRGRNKLHTEVDKTHDVNAEESVPNQDLEVEPTQASSAIVEPILSNKDSETKKSSEISAPNTTIEPKAACRPDCYGVNKSGVDDSHKLSDKPEEACEQSPPCREDCIGIQPIKQQSVEVNEMDEPEEGSSVQKTESDHKQPSSKPSEPTVIPEIDRPDETSKPKAICRADCGGLKRVIEEAHEDVPEQPPRTDQPDDDSNVQKPHDPEELPGQEISETVKPSSTDLKDKPHEDKQSELMQPSEPKIDKSDETHKPKAICRADCGGIKPKAESPPIEVDEQKDESNVQKPHDPQELPEQEKSEAVNPSSTDLIEKPLEDKQSEHKQPISTKPSEPIGSPEIHKPNEVSKPIAVCRADCGGIKPKPESKPTKVDEQHEELSLQKPHDQEEIPEQKKSEAVKPSSTELIDEAHEDKQSEHKEPTSSKPSEKSTEIIETPHEPAQQAEVEDSVLKKPSQISHKEMSHVKINDPHDFYKPDDPRKPLEACRPDCGGVKPSTQSPIEEPGDRNPVEAADKPDETCIQTPPCRPDCTGIQQQKQASIVSENSNNQQERLEVRKPDDISPEPERVEKIEPSMHEVEMGQTTPKQEQPHEVKEQKKCKAECTGINPPPPILTENNPPSDEHQAVSAKPSEPQPAAEESQPEKSEQSPVIEKPDETNQDGEDVSKQPSEHQQSVDAEGVPNVAGEQKKCKAECTGINPPKPTTNEDNPPQGENEPVSAKPSEPQPDAEESQQEKPDHPADAEKPDETNKQTHEVSTKPSDHQQPLDVERVPKTVCKAECTGIKPPKPTATEVNPTSEENQPLSAKPSEQQPAAEELQQEKPDQPADVEKPDETSKPVEDVSEKPSDNQQPVDSKGTPPDASDQKKCKAECTGINQPLATSKEADEPVITKPSELPQDGAEAQQDPEEVVSKKPSEHQLPLVVEVLPKTVCKAECTGLKPPKPGLMEVNEPHQQNETEAAKPSESQLPASESTHDESEQKPDVEYPDETNKEPEEVSKKPSDHQQPLDLEKSVPEAGKQKKCKPECTGINQVQPAEVVPANSSEVQATGEEPLQEKTDKPASEHRQPLDGPKTVCKAECIGLKSPKPISIDVNQPNEQNETVAAQLSELPQPSLDPQQDEADQPADDNNKEVEVSQKPIKQQNPLDVEEAPHEVGEERKCKAECTGINSNLPTSVEVNLPNEPKEPVSAKPSEQPPPDESKQEKPDVPADVQKPDDSNEQKLDMSKTPREHQQSMDVTDGPKTVCKAECTGIKPPKQTSTEVNEPKDQHETVAAKPSDHPEVSAAQSEDIAHTDEVNKGETEVPKIPSEEHQHLVATEAQQPDQPIVAEEPNAKDEPKTGETGEQKTICKAECTGIKPIAAEVDQPHEPNESAKPNESHLRKSDEPSKGPSDESVRKLRQLFIDPENLIEARKGDVTINLDQPLVNADEKDEPKTAISGKSSEHPQESQQPVVADTPNDQQKNLKVSQLANSDRPVAVDKPNEANEKECAEDCTGRKPTIQPSMQPSLGAKPSEPTEATAVINGKPSEQKPVIPSESIEEPQTPATPKPSVHQQVGANKTDEQDEQKSVCDPDCSGRKPSTEPASEAPGKQSDPTQQSTVVSGKPNKQNPVAHGKISEEPQDQATAKASELKPDVPGGSSEEAAATAKESELKPAIPHKSSEEPQALATAKPSVQQPPVEANKPDEQDEQKSVCEADCSGRKPTTEPATTGVPNKPSQPIQPSEVVSGTPNEQKTVVPGESSAEPQAQATGKPSQLGPAVSGESSEEPQAPATAKPSVQEPVGANKSDEQEKQKSVCEADCSGINPTTESPSGVPGKPSQPVQPSDAVSGKPSEQKPVVPGESSEEPQTPATPKPSELNPAVPGESSLEPQAPATAKPSIQQPVDPNKPDEKDEQKSVCEADCSGIKPTTESPFRVPGKQGEPTQQFAVASSKPSEQKLAASGEASEEPQLQASTKPSEQKPVDPGESSEEPQDPASAKPSVQQPVGATKQDEEKSVCEADCSGKKPSTQPSPEVLEKPSERTQPSAVLGDKPSDLTSVVPGDSSEEPQEPKLPQEENTDQQIIAKQASVQQIVESSKPDKIDEKDERKSVCEADCSGTKPAKSIPIDAVIKEQKVEPKVDEPNHEKPNTEESKIEEPKTEELKVEEPKVEELNASPLVEKPEQQPTANKPDESCGADCSGIKPLQPVSADVVGTPSEQTAVPDETPIGQPKPSDKPDETSSEVCKGDCSKEPPKPPSALEAIEEPKVDELKVEEPKIEETKKEKPKVEDAKIKDPMVEESIVEEPKVEAPKVEESKVDDHKVEEPKVEEPKVEDPKLEEPMVEETKVEEPKVEETKVEEPKVEEPEVEEFKVEEPKVEEPKVEETKVEEPKVEETKVEEPKVEETKVEEPKVEETKVEEPKVEEPKVEEPQVEKFKAEEPKVEEPKVEEPKVEEPKVDEPKDEEPKVEETKVEEPKVETPNVEELKVEVPMVEEPNIEESKVEEPKVEETKVEEPKVEESKIEEQKVEEPKIEEPLVEAAKVEEPKVKEPEVEEPKVEEPKVEEPKVEESKVSEVEPEKPEEKGVKEEVATVKPSEPVEKQPVKIEKPSTAPKPVAASIEKPKEKPAPKPTKQSAAEIQPHKPAVEQKPKDVQSIKKPSIKPVSAQASPVKPPKPIAEEKPKVAQPIQKPPPKQLEAEPLPVKKPKPEVVASPPQHVEGPAQSAYARCKEMKTQAPVRAMVRTNATVAAVDGFNKGCPGKPKITCPAGGIAPSERTKKTCPGKLKTTDTQDSETGDEPIKKRCTRKMKTPNSDAVQTPPRTGVSSPGSASRSKTGSACIKRCPPKEIPGKTVNFGFNQQPRLIKTCGSGNESKPSTPKCSNARARSATPNRPSFTPNRKCSGEKKQ